MEKPDFTSMKKIISGFIKHPLAKNFFVYSIGALFLKGVSFLLLPLYTKLLSPSEYGTLDLISTYSNILDLTLSFGLLSLIFIEYYHLNEEQRKKMFNGVISLYLILSTLLYIIIVLITIINKKSIFPDTSSVLIIVAAATSYLTFFQSLVVLILKQQERAAFSTILQIGSGMVSVILNVIFVYGYLLGVSGIIWSSFIGVFIFSGYSWYFILKEIKFRLIFNKRTFLNNLKLGLPFTFNAITLWLMTSANRWILLKYASLEDVGYFSIAIKFSSLFDPLIIQPFLGAYTPRIMNKFKSGNFQQYLPKIALFSLPAFLIAGFVLKEIAKFMIDEKFFPALALIPVLFIGNYFGFLAQISGLVLVYRKKITNMILSITLASIVSVVTNFLLVPVYMGTGSAIASILGGFVWFLAIYFFHRKEKYQIINGL